jgi:hypothetical protein
MQSTDKKKKKKKKRVKKEGQGERAQVWTSK